jgi:hypothetical protein
LAADELARSVKYLKQSCDVLRLFNEVMEMKTVASIKEEFCYSSQRCGLVVSEVVW